MAVHVARCGRGMAGGAWPSWAEQVGRETRTIMGSTRRGARAEDSNPNPNWRPDKQRRDGAIAFCLNPRGGGGGVILGGRGGGAGA
eukprot:scaffold34722_cov45-Phaeocystis_antarctica.AAC.3